MKHSSKKKPVAPAHNPTRPTTRFSPMHWAVLGLCLLVAAGSSWAVMEMVVWNTLPGDLVGKWVVQGGDQDGATFDFFRNGTMVGRINMRGQEGIVNARVAVEEDQLLLTTQNPMTRSEETRRQTIRSLSATNLVLQDEHGNRYYMERVKD